MKITDDLSNRDIMIETGLRLKDIRIATPLTQKELAEKSGVSTVTISAIENGKDCSLSTLISIMRVLNLTQGFEAFIPEQGARPSQMIALGKKRERATSRKHTGRSGEEEWKWGDEE